MSTVRLRRRALVGLLARAAVAVALLTTVSLVPSVAAVAATPAGVAPATADPDPAGTNMGNAGVLDGTGSGAILSGSDDWWVVYPATHGGPVTVTVSDNAASDAPCGGVEATLEGTGGTDESVSGTQFIDAGNAAQLAGRASDSDRYFVELTPWGCGSVTPYTVTLTSGGGSPLIPLSGAVTPGVSLGTAWPPLQGDTSYSAKLGNGGTEDWYALVKKPDTTIASIRVQDTTVNGSVACQGIIATLFGVGGTDEQDDIAYLQQNSATTFTVPGLENDDPQGRYYLVIRAWGCNNDGQTYTVEPDPGGEWASPARVPFAAATTSGDAMGSAWPPLQGHTVYASLLGDGGGEDWYALVKKPDATAASIRVQDTTVDGSSACMGIIATLFGAGGTDDVAQSAVYLQQNSAVTLTVSGKEADDTQGRYFLQIRPWGCSDDGQTYTVEPEAAAEWTNPARTPSVQGLPGSSSATAWPPLNGGISYHQSLGSGAVDDWYALLKKPDTTLATVRVQDTTVNGAIGCMGIVVTMFGSGGSSDPIQSASYMQQSSAVTFVLPGTEAGDAQGRYYLEIAAWGCNDDGQTYTVEPEAAAEFGVAGRALPVGPSRTAAAGPLSGGVDYTASLAASTTQDWAYFHANAAGSLRVQNTAAASNACKTVGVSLLRTGSATLSGAPGPGAVSVLNVAAAGDYAVELTTRGCAPKTALSAMVELSGSVRGPALTVTDPTLKTAVPHKAYSAAITVSGGTKPYTFAARTALPAGLVLNTKTGAVTGKATKAGSYTFMVAVTDATKPTHNTVTTMVHLTVS